MNVMCRASGSTGHIRDVATWWHAARALTTENCLSYEYVGMASASREGTDVCRGWAYPRVLVKYLYQST